MRTTPRGHPRHRCKTAAAAAVGLSRWMESVLFEVSPLDPATFLLVPAALLGAVLAATWLPARRATRIDPALALRGS